MNNWFVGHVTLLVDEIPNHSDLVRQPADKVDIHEINRLSEHSKENPPYMDDMIRIRRA